VSGRDSKGRFVESVGMYITAKGYWRYSAGVHRGKYVHRVVAEQQLGRLLKKDEVVHHRDGNRLNYLEHWDGYPNLQVMNERVHNAVSAAQYWFLKTFIWPRDKQEWETYFANVLQPNEDPQIKAA
jgi:hypothetical protein